MTMVPSERQKAESVAREISDATKRAEASEARVRELEAELAAIKDPANILVERKAWDDINFALAEVRDELTTLKADNERKDAALTWAMDEIDELANVACGFAYPQAMTIIGRKSQSDSYFAACTARRAALAKPEPADG